MTQPDPGTLANLDQLTAEHTQALEAFRTDQSDAARDRYKSAALALADARRSSREAEGRTGLGVTATSDTTEG